ncbi:hypothetical protein C1646_773104 [Rhizophagus diaphanus]|nr:hypothetical protein C1646_773104 [Rhizophagus diaphanus] [Rhizophagus sp. MUCL 43196]
MVWFNIYNDFDNFDNFWQKDSVSIYLVLADPNSAPEGCVQFVLVLWNPEDPTQYIYRQTHHRFTANETNWEDDQPTKSVPLALRQIFCNLKMSDTMVEKMELTKSFGAHSKADGATTKLFYCIYTIYDLVDIQINEKGSEGYGLQDAKKGIIFESFPPALHLQLEGFEYDKSGTYDRFKYSMEVDLEEFLSKDTDKSLFSINIYYMVIINIGRSRYYSLLKPEENGKWFIAFKFSFVN